MAQPVRNMEQIYKNKSHCYFLCNKNICVGALYIYAVASGNFCYARVANHLFVYVMSVPLQCAFHKLPIASWRRFYPRVDPAFPKYLQYGTCAVLIRHDVCGGE